MRIVVFVLSLLFVLGCKKSSEDAPVAPSLDGVLFSAYAYNNSSYPYQAVYRGYKFISKTRALDLLLDGSGSVISQSEVGYSYKFPDVVLESSVLPGVKLYGTIDASGSVLLVGSLKMLKR